MNAQRSAEIHTARVHLAESRKRLAMGHRGFAFTLLAWAANARRRAVALSSESRQMDLF